MTNITALQAPVATVAVTKDTTLQLYLRMTDVPPYWQQLAIQQRNLLLQKEYLQCLEDFAPDGIHFCYGIVYRQHQPVGIVYCQIKHFKAVKSLQLGDEKAAKSPCFFTTMSEFMRGWVASKVEFVTLVCGSLLFTGQHGFIFDPQWVSPAQQGELLGHCLQHIQLQLNKINKKSTITATLVKDYYTPQTLSALVTQHYNEFTIDPSMILAIPAHWHTFEDYLQDLHSKYRVRVRRAQKKLKGIVKKELHADEVAHHGERIFALYKKVAQNAGFNLVDLHPYYLVALKAQLPNSFRCFGYFLDDELVGFYTTIQNYDELEAHYLGFEPTLNAPKQIYLNILYDLLDIAIRAKAEKLIYARTAMEIKSSVGATAHTMYCYLRHQHSFANKFMKPLLDYLSPPADWLPRHPFKHQQTDDDSAEA